MSDLTKIIPISKVHPQSDLAYIAKTNRQSRRQCVFFMSVPRETLDQLLSGHLDGVLRGGERKQIEQLLRDDPSVASELEELRGLRVAMREIKRLDSRLKLDDGFADRVLSAAVAQAKTEGLSDDHPLVRLAEKPSRPEAKRLPLVRIAGAIVALAASIAIAIVVMQPTDKATIVAQLDPSTQLIPSTQLDPNSPAPDSDILVNSVPAETPQANLANVNLLIADPKIESDTPKPEFVAASAADSGGDFDIAPAMAAASVPTKISPKADPVTDNPRDLKPDAAPEFTEADMLALQQMESQQLRGAYLFVIKVERTELGKSNRSVRKTLKAAGLAGIKEKELTEDMVGFLTESSGENLSGRVMFLEASSKKVDVFVNRLFSDSDGIDSIGLGLAQTSSIIQVADVLAPEDPTTVRHDGSWELQGSGVDAVLNEIGRQQIPMRDASGNSRAPVTANSSDGPDGLSQVLIWIQ